MRAGHYSSFGVRGNGGRAVGSRHERRGFTTEAQGTQKRRKRGFTAEITESAEVRLGFMAPRSGAHENQFSLRALRDLRGESSSKLCALCASVVNLPAVTERSN
jgi:hypothetical protein